MSISEVAYGSGSGTLLPERQWHEQIIITSERVTLIRQGKAAGTMINSGTWEIGADKQSIAVLFRQLEAVDCSQIKRVEPVDPPDGGGTESFIVSYTRGGQCTLTYDPGVAYTGGDAIAQPVLAFIQSLALPPTAVSRYR